MRIGGAVSLLVFVLAVSLTPGQPAAAQQEPPVTIGQDTFGNVFAEGHTPTFRLTTSQSQPVDVHWVARDYWGQEVADGDATVPPDGLELAVPVDTVGYYDLTVTAEQEPAESSFAVVRPVDGGDSDDFRFGMQTHFPQGYDRRLVGVLETIGVATVRDSQPWQNIEICPGTQPGDRPTCDETEDVFDGPVSAYMGWLRDAGIEPLTNFGLGNPNYDAAWEDPPPVDTDGDGEPDEDPPPVWTAYTPHTMHGQDAFAQYVARVLDHYEQAGVDIGQVGIYNEPNLCRFGDWGDRRDGNWHNGGTANALPRPHADIARTNSTRVPDDVTLVGPDLFAPYARVDSPCNGFDHRRAWLDWLDEYLADALDVLDAVSLHPYRHRQLPEGLAEDQIQPVRDLIERHDNDDDPDTPPIWITEQGWRTDRHPNAVTEQTQAAHLPRTYVIAMAADVERFYWYNLKDHTSGAFGLVRQPRGNDPRFIDNTPKPSLVAYAVMTDQLTGLDWRGQDPNLGSIESHRFGPDQDPVRVMWVPDGSTEITLRAQEAVQVIDIMGGTTTHRPDAQGEVTFTLTEDVQYVHGNVETIPPG